MVTRDSRMKVPKETGGVILGTNVFGPELQKTTWGLRLWRRT
jgi:hypothetical protein